MKYLNSSGPSIGADVYLKKGAVVECTLEAHSVRDFICRIHADESSARLISDLVLWLDGYCSKKVLNPAVPCLYDTLPPFTQRVLDEISAIPFGEVRSYGEIAALIGAPNASRAVGGACGRNPIPLLVPCHRVLAKGNCLGGFSCDLEIKKRLLAFENISWHLQES